MASGQKESKFEQEKKSCNMATLQTYSSKKEGRKRGGKVKKKKREREKDLKKIGRSFAKTKNPESTISFTP